MDSKQEPNESRAPNKAGVHLKTTDRRAIRMLADFYSAFADTTRIKIISALSDAGELSVGGLAKAVGTSESAISHQLKLLRLLRLVTFRSDGRMAIYRLDDAHIEEILSAGINHISEQTGQ